MIRALHPLALFRADINILFRSL